MHGGLAPVFSHCESIPCMIWREGVPAGSLWAAAGSAWRSDSERCHLPSDLTTIPGRLHQATQ
jgi:hypothetical protein